MRQALSPVPASAVRDPEPQRPGYAIEVPCSDGYLFACEIDNATHGGSLWHGGGVGFCRPSGPVKVWSSRYSADYAAEKTGGRIVTVPRRIGETAAGPVMTWETVA